MTSKTPLQAYLAPADDRPKNGAWAPGHYLCKCLTCEGSFFGDKRAISCGDCAYAANPTPAPRLEGTAEASTIGEEAAKIVINLRPKD